MKALQTMDWLLAAKIILGVWVGLAILFVTMARFLGNRPGYAPGWRVRCRTCGATRPAGEAGIWRIGGFGKEITLGSCSQCGRLRWLVVERDPTGK